MTSDKTYSSFCKLDEMRDLSINICLRHLMSTSLIILCCSTILIFVVVFCLSVGRSLNNIHIEDMELDRNSGDIRLALAVDLGNMFIDDDYPRDIIEIIRLSRMTKYKSST